MIARPRAIAHRQTWTPNRLTKPLIICNHSPYRTGNRDSDSVGSFGHVGGNSDNVSNGNAGPSYLNANNGVSNTNTNNGARLAI